MPFLSWFREGDVLHRHALTGDCQVGRDPVLCPVSRPQDATVSRVHLEVSQRGGRWFVRDLESRNGVSVAGIELASGGQTELADGQEIRLGDWSLTYTEGFPGLDGVNFLEGVDDLFAGPPHSRGSQPDAGGHAAAPSLHRLPAGGGQHQRHVPPDPHRIPGPPGGGPGLRGDGGPRRRLAQPASGRRPGGPPGAVPFGGGLRAGPAHGDPQQRPPDRSPVRRRQPGGTAPGGGDVRAPGGGPGDPGGAVPGPQPGGGALLPVRPGPAADLRAPGRVGVAPHPAGPAGHGPGRRPGRVPAPEDALPAHPYAQRRAPGQHGVLPALDPQLRGQRLRRPGRGAPAPGGAAGVPGGGGPPGDPAGSPPGDPGVHQPEPAPGGGGAHLAGPAEDPQHHPGDGEGAPGHRLGRGQPGGAGGPGPGGAHAHAGARRRRGARGTGRTIRPAGPSGCTSRRG